MITLSLMRHGDALMDSEDIKRILSPKGRMQAQQSAKWLHEHLNKKLGKDKPLDCIITSPYTRAKQTAQIVADIVNAPIIECAKITPESDPEEAFLALEELCAESSNVLIVCHMPIIAHLHHVFCHMGHVSFSTAQICVLDAPVLAKALFTQQSYFTPQVSA